MAEFFRYCPLCGRKLISDGVTTIAQKTERECYLCLHTSHYPLVIQELRKQPALFSELLMLQEGGISASTSPRYCFFCGEKLEPYFTCEDLSQDAGARNLTYYTCCGSRVAHTWRGTQQLGMLDAVVLREQDFETLVSTYAIFSNQTF